MDDDGEPSPHGGKIFGLKFVDQVRELGIDDATKLFSAARRTRKHVGTELQEMCSTKLRQHLTARFTDTRNCVNLRAEEVGPDRQERDRSCVPVTQPHLVRCEHVPPLGVEHIRPMAGVIQCRRPRSQVRVGGQRKRRQAIGHAAQDCPLWRDLATPGTELNAPAATVFLL